MAAGLGSSSTVEGFLRFVGDTDDASSTVRFFVTRLAAARICFESFSSANTA